jgi:hypothetical protein
MSLDDEIWLPGNILVPDAPGSGTWMRSCSSAVPLPADADTARKLTIGELLAEAVLLDYSGMPYPGLRHLVPPGAVGS